MLNTDVIFYKHQGGIMTKPQYTKCNCCHKIMIEEIGKSAIFISKECLEMSRISIGFEVERCSICNSINTYKKSTFLFPDNFLQLA